MGAATTFSHQTRVLACAHCGAPVTVAVEGGQFACQYCQSINQVAGRNEASDLEQAAQALQATLSESERYARLREQDHRALQPPPSLAGYLSGSELAPEQVEAAVGDWVSTRAQLLAGAPFTTAERLFFLTILLSPKLDPARQRAMLETAAELLPDARQRQVVRCHLVQRAVLDGDLEAAEAWLRPCNARSTDLHTDTAYRLAAAYLHIGRELSQEVLNLLGSQPGEVPIADGHDVTAAVLRAHALERMGWRDHALGQLLGVMQADPTGFAEACRVLDANAPLGLCPETGPQARHQVWHAIELELRPKPDRGEVGCLVALVVAVLLCCGVVVARVTGVITAEMSRAISGSGHDASSEGFVMFAAVAGTLGLVALGFGIHWQRRTRQLGRRGVLMLVRLVSAERRPVKQGGNAVFTLVFELLPSASGPGAKGRFVRTESLAAEPKPGTYVALADPEKPAQSRVKLT